jgi:hypothetical protein
MYVKLVICSFPQTTTSFNSSRKYCGVYEGVFKRFRTESIKKYILTTSFDPYMKSNPIFKSFRTDRLEQELRMVQLSATKCSCIATAH